MAYPDFATEQYALTEAGYFIVRFLQRYDAIELAPDFAAASKTRVKANVGASLAISELPLRLHIAQD